MGSVKHKKQSENVTIFLYLVRLTWKLVFPAHQIRRANKQYLAESKLSSLEVIFTSPAMFSPNNSPSKAILSPYSLMKVRLFVWFGRGQVKSYFSVQTPSLRPSSHKQQMKWWMCFLYCTTRPCNVKHVISHSTQCNRLLWVLKINKCIKIGKKIGKNTLEPLSTVSNFLHAGELYFSLHREACEHVNPTSILKCYSPSKHWFTTSSALYENDSAIRTVHLGQRKCLLTSQSVMPS